jgi:adenylylsulfate kinase
LHKEAGVCKNPSEEKVRHLTLQSRAGAESAGQVVWFTGLSGAGKTTLSRSIAAALKALNYPVQILDGDAVRSELWNDLGFNRDDRLEHNRRLAYLAQLFSAHGITVLVAAISPLRAMRELPRSLSAHFCEVFVDAPLCVCEQRDVKGLYLRARSGELRNFTGIDAPYETPLSPEVTCHTADESLAQSTEKVLAYLSRRL